MSYVLVSLVGDEATQKADEFASWLEAAHPPTIVFREASPSHAAVKSAAAGPHRAVVFGHNGSHGGVSSLRAKATGASWATAPELGKLFPGARVYAYACETMGRGDKTDPESLGFAAKAAGVAAFAGHTSFLDAGWEEAVPIASAVEPVRKALGELILAFLGGESDSNKLKLAARASFDILLAGIQLGDPASVSSFQIPLAIHIAVECLVVVA